MVGIVFKLSYWALPQQGIKQYFSWSLKFCFAHWLGKVTDDANESYIIASRSSSQ